MNAWEGQVLAIAVKELFEAVKTLRLGGDKRELSEVIRDLLSVHPNITRSEALLDTLEAKASGRPSPDLFLAKKLLAAIRKRRLLDEKETAAKKGLRLTPTPPSRPGPIPGARRIRPPRSTDPTSLPPRRSRSRRRLRPGSARNPDRDAPRRRGAGEGIFRTSREGSTRRRVLATMMRER
jgi:hypothetical protein